MTSPTHIANVNPFRYRGYYYDTESGFYYLQSRYYDPTTGRFINADGQIGKIPPKGGIFPIYAPYAPSSAGSACG
ncbi:MAG: RHS repeat-associated core domain-containing protein [Acutalibacteraceae bacterium]